MDNHMKKAAPDPILEPNTVKLASFDENPVSKHELKGAKHYFGLFAGEHVAGTEFAVGAVFVTWGVSTVEFLQGLLIGNAIAVLLWTFFPALLAVKTRQTLYALLKRVCGPQMQKIFNLMSGIVYCTMGGAMITISASAIRILFNIPPQVGLYPTSFMFVILVLVIGMVTTLVAIYGFDGVSRFSGVCAPWLLVVFLMGGLIALPTLLELSGESSTLSSFAQFIRMGDELIWIEGPEGLTKWHVAAFAIFCNLTLHVGLTDMAVFRFAKTYKYGFISAIGVFFGHFLAWICSCMMGAATAAMLKANIRTLDTGDISYTIMGTVGLLAVVIAGWTTANPNIYRSGLAFQSVFNRLPIRKVTLAAGIITSIIACFPFIFSKLNEYMNIIGLAAAPVGAVVICDYWILPKLNMTRWWCYYRKDKLNKAAISAWIGGLIVTIILGVTGTVDFFFLFIPCFLSSSILYIVLAYFLGARENYEKEEKELAKELEEISKRQHEAHELQAATQPLGQVRKSDLRFIFLVLSIGMLVICFAMAVMVFTGTIAASVYQNYAIIPTLAYFVFAICYSKAGEEKVRHTKKIKA